MKPFLLAVFLLAAFQLSAQSPEAERESDFTAENTENGTAFTPRMPPLIQKPGAPKAHYKYLWTFGDGGFSREEKPVHAYASDGEYLVSLDATNYYDDGKKPKKRSKPTKVKAKRSGLASEQKMPDVFETKHQAIALGVSDKPKAGEEITCILSYRNGGSAITDGRLHLFFNEKRFAGSHFRYVNSQPCFGETEDNAYGLLAPGAAEEGWTLRTNEAALLHLLSRGRESGLTASAFDGEAPPGTIIEAMLKEARGEFRESRTWRFSQLRGTEARNFFLTLAGTSAMVRDTNTTIQVAAIFEPSDASLAPERFTLSIPIVASHDPNAIAVSDNRVNYRFLGSQKLDYTVDFQNNGEGPASTVELLITVPEGLKLTHMRPLDWYPKCPLCSQVPKGQGCLDTATTNNTLKFTFRNIYLPGSRQADVNSIDSTRGFVHYRIEPEQDMPKLSFRKQARITFDKNPPIYTNFSKTRFKPGLSPGPKIGYSFPPDSLKGGYYFMGASFAPFKPWKIFPQAELLIGVRERTDQGPPERHADTLSSVDVNLYQLRIRDSTVRRSRGFLSFEVPLSIRKNFNRFLGAGIGFSGHFILEHGKAVATVSRTQQTLLYNEVPPAPVGFILESEKPLGDPVEYCFSYTDLRFRPAVFADVSLGSVRAGPSLNLRAGGLLSGGFEPYLQLALEMKL